MLPSESSKSLRCCPCGAELSDPSLLSLSSLRPSDERSLLSGSPPRLPSDSEARCTDERSRRVSARFKLESEPSELSESSDSPKDERSESSASPLREPSESAGDERSMPRRRMPFVIDESENSESSESSEPSGSDERSELVSEKVMSLASPAGG